MNQSNTTSSRFLGGKELYINPTYIPWYIRSLSDGLSQGRQQICQTECSDNDYNLCWQWPYFGPNKVAPHKSSRPLLSIPFQLESTTNSPAICGYHWVHANCHRNMEIFISLGLNPHLCWWSCLEIAEDSSCWCPTSLTIPHIYLVADIGSCMWNPQLQWVTVLEKNPPTNVHRCFMLF